MLSQWCALDLGRALSQVWVAPLDLGSTPAPRTRVCWPLGAVRRGLFGPPSTDFPCDSADFVEMVANPYI